MQERDFSSGENSGGGLWGEALFWAEDWQRRGSGRSLQLGWGGAQYLWEQAASKWEAPQTVSWGPVSSPEQGSEGWASNTGQRGSLQKPCPMQGHRLV